MNFELIRDSINYKNVYRLYDKDSGSSFTDLLEVVTLELPKIPARAEGDPVIPWLKFISINDKEQAMTVVEQYPQLKEAYEQLQVLSLDESNRDEYEQRLKWYMDELNLLRARDAAEEKGYERGVDQGLEQGVCQTARNMKLNGFAIADIAKCTGLTAEEIAKL